jgi:hypothetical protein
MAMTDLNFDCSQTLLDRKTKGPRSRTFLLSGGKAAALTTLRMIVRLYHTRQLRFPFDQQPTPDKVKHQNVHKTKHQTAPKHDRVIHPRILLGNPHPRHNNRPRQHPAKITHQRLVQVPARAGGQQDCGELGGDGVEDVAPVDCAPHFGRDFGDARRGREVEGEGLGAVDGEEDAEDDFDEEGEEGGDDGGGGYV